MATLTVVWGDGLHVVEMPNATAMWAAAMRCYEELGGDNAEEGKPYLLVLADPQGEESVFIPASDVAAQWENRRLVLAQEA